MEYDSNRKWRRPHIRVVRNLGIVGLGGYGNRMWFLQIWEELGNVGHQSTDDRRKLRTQEEDSVLIDVAKESGLNDRQEC